MSKEYLISGNFLGKETVGLTRKALQYVLQLDNYECARRLHIAVPEDLMPYCPQLCNIEVISCKKNSKGWNTNVAMQMARKNKWTYVNFTSPFAVYGDSIVSIDDVRYMEKTHDEWYDSYKFRKKMYFRAKIGTSVAGNIVTVSEFSKKRIMNFFNVKSDRIKVIPNGWEHILHIKSDSDIYKKYDMLEKKEFFFTLGSLAKHKNHKFIIELANNNPDRVFVVGGGIDPEIWFSGSENKNTHNLIFTGRLSDGEMKFLMEKCRAFIFPSLYEGFGIPPLEALACGTDVIVSDIEVHKEIFKNSVRYINPYDSNILLEDILSQKVEDSSSILDNNSWKRAGECWNELFSK